ncbi:MAG: TPM domain-containing protein [Bacteroidota bacterium]|nr:TPM domain-containing protein [Bacteroidota bacterium]
MKKFISAFVLILSISIGICKSIPEMPNPPRLVNDFAGVLNQNESIYLEKKLRAYNDSTSSQIAIVIENSLEGEEVFDYSMKLAEAWKIGQKGKDNGILIYIAIAERKIRIQVGYGLEARVTDAYTKRIIEEIIKPQFKQQNYYQGLNDATDVIIQLASGEYKGEPKKSKRGFTLGTFIFFAIIAYIIFSFFRRGGGGNSYGKRGLDPWTAFLLGSALSGGGRGSSYGDFSSGSGSFGGFGGGGFGGGGSGGDW